MNRADRSLAILLSILFCLSLLSGSCTKRDRSTLGISQYPDSLLLAPDTLVLDSILHDSTYHHFVSTGGSRTLLLGFEADYEAWALFRFQRGLSDYDSAHLEFSPVDESLGVSLDFSVHRITVQDWEDTLVVWPFQDYGATPLVQVQASPSDTLVLFDCPPPETTVADGDTSLFWNLLFVPAAGGMARLSSDESETRPTLRLYDDTVSTDLSPVADAYVIEYAGSFDPSLLWVGSGWVLRSGLKFDIPDRLANSIINKADLVLHADTVTKWMEIVAFVPDAGVSAVGHLDTGVESATLSVAELVQYWLDEENAGLTLKATDETNKISRAGLFSSSDPDRHPVIYVTYTKKVYED